MNEPTGEGREDRSWSKAMRSFEYPMPWVSMTVLWCRSRVVERKRNHASRGQTAVYCRSTLTL